MTEIGFYHLTRSTLEQALPRLLETIVERGLRVVLRTATEDRVAAVDRHLWTYRPDSWLPHGTSAEGRAEDQPVWITTALGRPNGATVLVLVDGGSDADVAEFDRVVDMFDGADEAALTAARERWKAARAAGHKLVYWQEGERSGWQKAAVHPPEGG